VSEVPYGLTAYRLDLNRSRSIIRLNDQHSVGSIMEEVKKSLVIVMLLGCVASISMPVTAGYEFSVKVINKTGAMLANVTVFWKAKGSGNQKTCWSGGKSIQNNNNYQRKCADSGTKENWQRQIRVKYVCPNSSSGHFSGDLSFPRGSNYYKRKHASDNGDKYTVTVKASDC